MARLVLLHSPFVGPASWGGVAAELSRRGHAVTTPVWPRLEPIPDNFYRTLAQDMAAQIETGEGAPILVAHSGGGALIPALEAALATAPAGVILVDAILPHPGKAWLETAPPQLALQLRNGVDAGLLPPWDQWWPPGALERLVPDAAARTALVSELEGLPLDYLEEQAPAMTLSSPAAYLQLSGAYDDEGQYAVRQGWPVVRLPLHHLAMLTHAEAVAGAIDGLAARLPHA
ncbi:alpha/beta fold hydrolase [uncultured Phenylobacterium sp.]|uniref:alpha/beta fold hydrolase n=1 Tax=uncultured Phenylobacterium sp. TaxID=349273 RepID=UPI0025D7C733|nr:alpha/beta fold hydrolase [uncultured Phenylobacterium sp.]